MAAEPKVPRGTLPADADKPITFPLQVRADLREAARHHEKTTHRCIVAAGNSSLARGRFQGLRLDTGRVRTAVRPFLRVQCDFGNGRVRVVSVTSQAQPGHLFWIKTAKSMPRSQSRLIFDVNRVGVSRVMDLTDEQAIAEGVNTLSPKVRRRGTPRDWFAWLWDDLHGAGAWRRNDWVWIYDFSLIEAQVDHWLAGKDHFP